MYNFLSRSISKSNCCLSRICKKAPKYAVKKAMSEPFGTIKVPIKKPIEFSKASTSHDGKLLTKKCSYQVMHRSLFPDPPKEVIQIMMFSTSSSEYFYTSTINQDRRKSNNQKAVEVYKQALENVMKIKFQKKRIDDPFMNADYKVKPYRSTSGPDPLEKNIAKVQEKLDQPSKSYLPAVRLNKTLMRQAQPKVDWTRKKRPPTLNFEHPHLKQFKIVYPTYKLKNKLAVRDADQDKPQVWNNKMKKVYRVEPPSDRIIVRPYNNKLACTSGNSNENKRVLGDKYSMVVMKRRNKLDQLMRAAHDLQKEALRIRKKMIIGKHPTPVLSYEDKVKENSYRPEEDELFDLEPKENLLRVEKFLGTSLVKSENSNEVLNVQKYIEAPVPAENLRFNKKSEVETIKLINDPDHLKEEISEQPQPVQEILSYVEKLKRLKEQSSMSKSVLKLPVKGEEKITEQITVAEHFDEIKKPFYKKVLKKYINVNEILDMPSSKDIIKPPENMSEFNTNILLSKNTDLPPKKSTSKKSFEDILSKYAKNEPPKTKSDANLANKVKTLLKPANEYIEKLKEAGESKIKNLETSIDEQIRSIENSLDEMKNHITGSKSTTNNNSPPEKVLTTPEKVLTPDKVLTTTDKVLSTPANSKDSNKKIVTLDRKESKAVTKIIEKTKAEEKAKSNEDKYKIKQKPLIEQMRDNIDASIKEDYQKTFGESFKLGEEKTIPNMNEIIEPNSNLTIKSGAMEKWMLDNKLTVNMKDSSKDESFINTTNKTGAVPQTPPPTFATEKQLQSVTQKDKSPSKKLTPTPASRDHLNKEPDHILQKQAMDQYQEESYDHQSREEEDEEFYPKDYKKSKFQSQLDEVPEKWLKKKYNEMKMHQRVSYVDELIRDETPEEKILRKYHDMKMDSTQRSLSSGEAPEDWARRKYKELQASQKTSTESTETPEQWFQRNHDKLKPTTEIKAAPDDLKVEEKKSETPEEWLRRKYKEFKSKLYGQQKEIDEKQESDEMKAKSSDDTPDVILGATYEVNPKEKPEQWALRKLEDYANDPSLLEAKSYKEDDYDDGKKYKAKYYEDDDIEYKTKSYKDDGDTYKTKSYYDDDDEGLKYKTKSYYDDDDEGSKYKTKSYYGDDDDYNKGNKYQTKSYYSDDDRKHYKTKSYEDDDDYRYETKSFDDDKLYKYDDEDEVRKYKEIKAASNYETKHDKDYDSEYPEEKFMKKVKKTKSEYEEFYIPEKYAAKPYRLESETQQFDSEFVPRDDRSYEEKIRNKYIKDDAPYSEKMKRKYKDMKLKSTDDSGEYEEEFIKLDDYKYHPREEETFFETTDKPHKKGYYAKERYEEKDEEEEEGGKYASELGDLVGEDSKPKETYIMKPHEEISNKTPTTSWVSAIENFSKELAAKAGIISLDNKYKEDGRLKQSDVELSSFTEEPLDTMYKSKTEMLDEIIRENEQKADFKQVDDDEKQVAFDQEKEKKEWTDHPLHLQHHQKKRTKKRKNHHHHHEEA